MNGAKCCGALAKISARNLSQSSEVFRRLQEPLEIIGTSSVMFGSRRNTFGNLWQCSEVIRHFSEIQVIWIRKSHAFDLGKVGRYKAGIKELMRVSMYKKYKTLGGARKNRLWYPGQVKSTVLKTMYLKFWKF